MSSGPGVGLRLTPQSFLEQGEPACRSERVNPDWFFPTAGGSPMKAKRVCLDCPLRAGCLEWALVQPWRDLFGIFGGTTQEERRRMLGHRR